MRCQMAEAQRSAAAANRLREVAEKAEKERAAAAAAQKAAEAQADRERQQKEAEAAAAAAKGKAAAATPSKALPEALEDLIYEVEDAKGERVRQIAGWFRCAAGAIVACW